MRKEALQRYAMRTDHPIWVEGRHYDREYRNRPHQHAFTEVFIVIQGTGNQVIGQDTMEARPGDIFILAPERVHQTLFPANAEFLKISFDPVILREHEEELRLLPGYQALFLLESHHSTGHVEEARLHIPEEDLRTVLDYAERLKSELAEGHPGCRLMASAVLIELVIFLSRACQQSDASFSRHLLELGRVISLMERDYALPLTLEDLAREACMSPRTLERHFRKITGLSPMEYLVQLRTREARLLLRHTDLPIAEIASRTGMPNGSYFNRQFKRFAGITPRAYRKNA